MVTTVGSDGRTLDCRREPLEHLVVEPRKVRANLGILLQLDETAAEWIAFTAPVLGPHASEGTARCERNLIGFRFQAKMALLAGRMGLF